MSWFEPTSEVESKKEFNNLKITEDDFSQYKYFQPFFERKLAYCLKKEDQLRDGLRKTQTMISQRAKNCQTFLKQLIDRLYGSTPKMSLTEAKKLGHFRNKP